MKTYKLITALVILVLIVGSCNIENDLNKLPSVPELLEPENGAVVDVKDLALTWEASSDAEGNDIMYYVMVSEDEENWTEYYERTTEYVPNNVFVSGKSYYWKVRAENNWDGVVKDEEDGESVSVTRQFYTSPLGVTELDDTSGYKYVTLTWKDIEDMDYAEISFIPEIEEVAQPIFVDAGIETATISELENGIVYTFYVTAYNNLGHQSMSDSITSLPLQPDEVHDADYNIYTSVKIGEQTWLRENLRTTTWQDGTEMLNYHNELIAQVGSKSDIYGYYYLTDYALGISGESRNPCPCNYHVPIDDEWKELELFLEIPEDELDITCYDDGDFYRGEAQNSGKMLKSTTGWEEVDGVDGNGTDLYGFNLLPAGYIYQGEEIGVGSMARLSTSTKGSFYYYRFMSSEQNGIFSCANLWLGSIRCIKDQE